MKPTKEELINCTDIKEAARHFDVSERTIRRWMKQHNIYNPKDYSSKLNLSKAREIRLKYKQGSKMKDLSDEYNVSVVTISKVVNNLVHKEPEKEVAIISVIYNC